MTYTYVKYVPPADTNLYIKLLKFLSVGIEFAYNLHQ